MARVKNGRKFLMFRNRYGFILYLALFVITVQCFVVWTFFSFSNEENNGVKALSKENSKDEFFQIEDSLAHQKNRNNYKPLSFVQTENVQSIDEEGFSCEIESKEAQSALNRAKSIKCKKEIAEIACKVQENQDFYPKILPRYCPISGKVINQAENLANNIITEKPIRIVYILIINGRAVRQIKRLFKALYHVDHYFYIHVDSRMEYLYRDMSEIVKLYPNTRMTPWQMSTIWGGASLLQMLLGCMKDLLTMSDWKWDFVINMSESDYPIRTNSELVEYLSARKQYNFLKSHGRDDEKFIKKQGLDRTFFECDYHMWRIGNRDIPKNIVIDGGSDWIVLNRQAIQYITMRNNVLIKGLNHFYKYTLLPAESFFHTVLQNSELCHTVVDNNLRLTNWRRKQGCQCQYKHIVDWCGCSPNDIYPSDLHRFKDHGKPVFFARKFEAVISQSAINELDAWLFGSYPKNMPGLHSYWENIFHFKDKITMPTSTYWTFYQSFIRLSKETINSMADINSLTKDCLYKELSEPLEVTMYFKNDEFKGYLIKFEGKSENGFKDTMETWAVPYRRGFKILSPLGPIGRILSFEVCSNYDLKEQVFRNFGCLLGPFEQPQVLIKLLKGGPSYSIKLLGIDPTNRKFLCKEKQLVEDDEIVYLKCDFNQPLCPGKWTVQMQYQDQTVAETDFVISPLAFKDLKPLTENAAVRINGGPRQSIKEEHVYKKQAQTNAAITEAENNSHKTGDDLNIWIDSVVKNIWNIRDFCLMSNNYLRSSCSLIKRCNTVEWSSYSPDPKSEMQPLSSNGRIR